MSLEDLERASGGIVKQTKYLKKNPLRQFLIRRYLQTISGLAREASPQLILDVGSGEGFVINHLRENFPAAHLTGIDIELEVLKVASYLNPGSLFAAASAEQLPIPSRAYDLVCCNEVLEHVPEPKKVLSEIARVGSKNFIFSVPREPHYRLANMAAGANWSRWGDDIDHCQRWTTRQFIQMLAESFEVLRVKTPFPWSMVLCRKREARDLTGN